MTELDPRPFVGWSGHRHSDPSWASLYDGPATFEPREGYEQDRSKYPL